MKIFGRRLNTIKRHKIIVLSLLFLFFLFGITNVNKAFATDYQINGSVKDNSGGAIIGATVNVYTPGTTTDVIPATTTDQTGYYEFPSLPEGSYDIKITPPAGSNFSPAIALSQTVTSNYILNFVLVPAGSIKISGIVSDENGLPLSGQPVKLVLSGNNQVASGVTDSSGAYSFCQVSLLGNTLSKPNGVV